MKSNQLNCFFSLLLLITSLLAMVASAQSLGFSGKAQRVYTPSSGRVERKAILDAMRNKVKEMHDLDVVFVVKSMKVRDGWAWVHTMPRSEDGSSRYENFSALLRKVDGRWRVVEIPCTEPDNSECIDSSDYFSKLLDRFPGLPLSILPAATLER
ncbi:MAG TPA: hypothetical protein ENL07_09825 [Chlorobaculum parvum]|uniref:DUF4878 domain-containing protein n=1 Tax=Chlorobaculum parvum TaxID=274539 RepID=A0A7C5DJL0_9CHLB|nr:hypothetical protein [Chlorobaculum parvum]